MSQRVFYVYLGSSTDEIQQAVNKHPNSTVELIDEAKWHVGTHMKYSVIQNIKFLFITFIPPFAVRIISLFKENVYFAKVADNLVYWAFN